MSLGVLNIHISFVSHFTFLNCIPKILLVQPLFKLKCVVEILQLIKSYFTYFMVCMIMIEFD